MSKRKPVTNATNRPPNPLSFLRAQTIPNKKRKASRLACRKVGRT